MADSWKTIESEMDRFETEISSLGKPTTTTVTTPAFIPASVRKPPGPPPKAKLTPVVISGGPQLYTQQTIRAPIPISSLIRPTQIDQRLIRPGILPGSPPITPATGRVGLGSSSSVRQTSPASSSSTSLQSPTSVTDSEKPKSVPLLLDPAPSTSTSTTSASKTTKKKKKKQTEEKKPRKHIRSAGGTVWEDTTLLDWDPKDFRLFCGDLGNDVTDEVLTRVFGRYPSFVKARVVRDKRSNKTKGYGFVSFKDPGDFVRAIRELDGRYVGSRPIKLRKSTWESRGLSQVRKREKVQKQLLGIGKPPK